MLRTMLHTFCFRVATALLSLGLLVASTRYLGAEGRGVLSLALTGMGVIGMLSGFMGGSSLVYLLSRRGDRRYWQRVIGLSSAWAAAVALAGTAVMRALGVVPPQVTVHVLLLGLLANLLAILSYSLLSAERILRYNLIAVLQVAVTLGIFGIWPMAGGRASVGLYLAALYCSYLACLALASSLHSNLRRPRAGPPSGAESLLATGRGVLRYGLMSQAGLVIQFLNYRLSFFFLNHHAGTAAVGVYSVGSLLAESLWMLPGSIALVLYARVSSAGETKAVQETTISLAKLSLAATLVMLGVLLAIPPSLLAAVFGRDFGGVGQVILCMAPGILALSYSMVINHFLAGIGLFLVNTRAAALGLAVTVAGNLLLVPRMGLPGAALTSSAAYLATAAYAVHFFMRRTGIPFRRLLPEKTDLVRLLTLLK